MTPKRDADFSEREAQQRRDAALRAALSMPAIPRANPPKPKVAVEKAKSRKALGSKRT
jgi:hypothetical protein